MKNLKKFLTQKKIAIPLSLFFLFTLIAVVYFSISVSKNIREMTTAASEATPYFPDYPPVHLNGKDPEVVKRGEYLAKAGDCIACHTNTPTKGTAFAGGLPMHTPFGTIYSPNITPDRETGIGNWTEEQFIRAMREGISPDGHYYYPAFPYFYFNKITTEDLKAIKAYLDTLEPVKQQNRPNEMVKPFNKRFLQLGWRVLFFHPEDTGPFKTNPHQTEQWNRGAYLVEGLGHCAMCHSPSYHILSSKLPLGAPIRKYDLTGSSIQGYLAPNITKVNLANVSENEIIRVFTEDRLIGGGKVEGPMLEVDHDSLRYLTHTDLLAIATYLKSVQSQTPPKPRTSGGPGASVYEGYCAGCHATGSGGAPKYGDVTAWDTLLKGGMDKLYVEAIHGIASMPAKGTCLSCTDPEIKAAVDYMITAVKGETAKGPAIPPPKPLTLEDGKHIYDENCSVCHNSGFKEAPQPGDQKTWEPIIHTGLMAAYQNVLTGQAGHVPRGGCMDCTDGEIKAAIKYMMTTSSPNKNFELW